MSAAESPLRVVYIAGFGRSGSTLLQTLLGQAPEVTSVGELRYLPTRGLVERQLCGCGEPVPECPFWSRVVAKAEADGVDFAAVRHWQLSSARTRNVLRGEPADADWRSYVAAMSRIYTAIGEVGGTRVVVDSSKFPADALAACRCDGVEARVVHLVRDPRAVAFSWGTPKADPASGRPMAEISPTRSTVDWITWNLVIPRRTTAAGAAYKLLRYEDFVEHPAATVDDLLSWAGVDHVSTLDGSDRSFVLSRREHSISGNPGKFGANRLEIRRDDRWRSQMTSSDRAVVSAMALPIARRLGYPAWGGS